MLNSGSLHLAVNDGTWIYFLQSQVNTYKFYLSSKNVQKLVLVV